MRARIRVAGLRRPAYTLIELTVSMSIASLLMAGLASALFVSTQAFNGQHAAQTRSRAFQVQADMLNDLQQATGFTTRTSTSVTFTVPDRDLDLVEETVSYDWNGGTNELTYTYNGSSAETLLTNVDSFDLTYLGRTLVGTAPTPSPLDPNSWGDRWANPNALFGYDTTFTDTHKEKNVQHATSATLSEDGTVFRITAYIELTAAVNSQLTYAIYDDNGGDPDNLLVASGIVSIANSGWHAIDIAPTSLTAGTYWLALSYDDKKAQHHFDSSSGQRETRQYSPFSSGWESSWGNGPSLGTGSISIYAEYTPD